MRSFLLTLALGLVFVVCFLGPLFLARAFADCHSHACWKRIHDRRAEHWLRTHRPWLYAWRHLSRGERSWAHCIATYETYGIPWSEKAATDTGNGYQGSTQWLVSTWHAAGGSGEPKYASLHEQLVRTVRWAHRAGSSQWSTSRTCGVV
jgi:hypothetical protein